MPPPQPHNVTGWLLAWSQGDERALHKLIPVVYKELRRKAHHCMSREREGPTLQTTALVHEAYERLVDAPRVQWQNRTRFYAMCARLMRRILVNHARSRQFPNRGGGARQVPLDEVLSVCANASEDLVAFDKALIALAIEDPRKARMVELRFFGGLTVEETAHVLAVSPETVARDWRLAKALLLRELTGDHHGS